MAGEVVRRSPAAERGYEFGKSITNKPIHMVLISIQSVHPGLMATPLQRTMPAWQNFIWVSCSVNSKNEVC